MTAIEIREIAKQYRQYHCIKKEAEKQLELLKKDIIAFLDENEVNDYIGDDFNFKRIEKTKTSFDNDKLKELLGNEISDYQKTMKYNEIRVS